MPRLVSLRGAFGLGMGLLVLALSAPGCQNQTTDTAGQLEECEAQLSALQESVEAAHVALADARAEWSDAEDWSNVIWEGLAEAAAPEVSSRQRLRAAQEALGAHEELGSALSGLEEALSRAEEALQQR